MVDAAPVFARRLWPQQLAVGVKGAAPLLVHWARTILELHPSWVLFKIDFRNAFNTVERAALLRAIRDDPLLCHWYPTFYAWISKAADCRVGFGKVSAWFRSEQGGQQGDGLVMAAFCRALHPHLVACDVAMGVDGELRAPGDSFKYMQDLMVLLP